MSLMNKNYYIIIVLVIIVLVGGLFYYAKPFSNREEMESQTEDAQVAEEAMEEAVEEAMTVPEMKNVVVFKDGGLTPETLTIKTGETVVFKNESDKPVWPASAMHPTHNDYPITGGCAGSSFDACGNVEGGSSWSFTFTEKGSWKYHDHLNPSLRGTIVVE